MARCAYCGNELSWTSKTADDGRQYCGICYDNLDQIKEEETRNERIQNMVASSLFYMEGKKVIKYFDIITSEVVMGTGFLSELGASVSDILGVRSPEFESKLKTAKEKAISKLKYDAVILGANSVLGVDIDYMTVGANMFMVIASGTPVIVE